MFEYGNIIVNGSEWRASCVIAENLSCLKGHFPTMPIVPAIAQLDMVMGLVSHVSQTRCVMNKASVLKFMGLIKPHDVASLVLKVNDLEVKFDIYVGDRLCTRGKFTFRQLV